MLPGCVFVVMGITLMQERKTERALALRDLSHPWGCSSGRRSASASRAWVQRTPAMWLIEQTSLSSGNKLADLNQTANGP